MLSKEDLKALDEFINKYPTWWYTIGVCDISRDFTCAPQAHSPESKYTKLDQDCPFNSGFMCDHKGTLADAIHEVMKEINELTYCFNF